MSKSEKEFVEEITDKFSELFIETFFIRYLSDYPKEDLINTLNLTTKKLNKKIIKLVNKKLQQMGFDSTSFLQQ